MINYVEANCALPPLSRPQYDEDSDTWDIHFQDKEDGEVICLAFESLEEAQQLLKQALSLQETQDEEDTE
jgi:hydroxylamine reductase (hybrid-cluster protein)